ncbi:MAG: hypothetical protein WCK82_11735 [Bacteroidota bacterium]
MKINIDAIYILRFDEKTNLTILDYEKIERPLDNDFEQLESQFNIEHMDAKKIISFVKNHSKLKILLNKYNYCAVLNESYQGLFIEVNAIEAKYSSNFQNQSNKEDLKKKEKEVLLKDLNDRLQACYLETTYKICEQKRLQKSILAYSHRKVGWSAPSYELNSNFSIELKTNFGYGYVSYFYTKIKYKGLDIIPFSNWIIYERAQLFEIVRYSAKHRPDNESWYEALTYSRDACNLSLTNEIDFVRKYVIDECERMVNGLEDFLVGDKFKFLNYKNISTYVHKEGHNLIEFRGEKLSGALDFIEKIIQFEIITEINDFVKRIERCNLNLQPLLKKELELIETELSLINKKISDLLPFVEELEKRYTYYRELKSNLKDTIDLNIEINFNNEVLEKRFIELYPEYDKLKNEYIENRELIEKFKSQKFQLELTSENIEKYKKKIDVYFEPK